MKKSITSLFSLAVILAIVAASLLYLFGSNPGGIREYSSSKDYSEIMTHLQLGLISHGYEIEKIQPIDKGLARAGKKIETYRIIFFNPRHTIGAIQRKYPGFSALLPLSITVAKHKNKIVIVSSPYKFLSRAARGKDIRALVKLWQQDSDSIIKQALKQSETPFKLKTSRPEPTVAVPDHTTYRRHADSTLPRYL